MNITERELSAGFRRSMMSTVRGERMRHVVTHNPNNANPREELYIDIPKTKPSSYIVPGSVNLLFDIEVTATEETSDSSCGRDSIRLHTRVSNLHLQGPMEVQQRARRHDRVWSGGDDTGATSGDAQKVSDAPPLWNLL